MNKDDRMRELFSDLVRENRPVGQQKEIIKPKIPQGTFCGRRGDQYSPG